MERSPTTQSRRTTSAASAAGLAPVHCRCTRTRPVSYYALFQGWLLLSQPPGCQGDLTSFDTEPGIGGLSRRSGLFPSRQWSLAPTVSLSGPRPGIRALIGGAKLSPANPVRGLPPGRRRPRLHLNAFRGEPAISRFVWHFTSTHSSSLDFEPSMGSALQPALPGLQPGHG